MTIRLTRRSVAIAVAGFLALTAVTATTLVVTLTSRAEANHRFDDIADGTFFHDSTAWLKDNGIADGFDDGTFRRNDPITRGQASYWFSNFNDGLEIVTDGSFDPPAGLQFFDTVECPAGKRSVAGGGHVNAANVFVRTSYPSSATAWTVVWESEGNGTLDPSSAQVWALCIPGTIDTP